MARPTTISKLTFVRVIPGMAGITILGSCLQISNTSSPTVAGATVQWGMFPGQLEGDFPMIEIMTIAIDPIVAGQAALSVGLKVRLHEISLDLLVTGSADSLVKGCVTIYVAHITYKWRTIRLALVGSQGITECSV